MFSKRNRFLRKKRRVRAILEESQIPAPLEVPSHTHPKYNTEAEFKLADNVRMLFFRKDQRR